MKTKSIDSNPYKILITCPISDNPTVKEKSTCLQSSLRVQSMNNSPKNEGNTSKINKNVDNKKQQNKFASYQTFVSPLNQYNNIKNYNKNASLLNGTNVSNVVKNNQNKSNGQNNYLNNYNHFNSMNSLNNLQNVSNVNVNVNSFNENQNSNINININIKKKNNEGLNLMSYLKNYGKSNNLKINLDNKNFNINSVVLNSDTNITKQKKYVNNSMNTRQNSVIGERNKSNNQTL